MHFRKRIVRLAAAIVVLAAAMSAMLVAPASAATYELWHFRDGQICYQDHGSTRWDGIYSVPKWNVADVNLVTLNDCSAYPRYMVIDLKTYNDPADYACAKTGSEGNDYSWVYVSKNGVRTAAWAPNRMTIWINTSAALQPKCTATSGMRAHLLTHELGHAIGLGHPPAGSPVSVMRQGAWSVWWPTSWDLANANAYY